MGKFLNKLLGRKQKEKYNKPLPLPAASSSSASQSASASSATGKKLPKPVDAASEVQEAMLLRGLTDPSDYKYRLSLAVGDMLDVQDKQSRWRPAEITNATPTHVTVRFVDSGKTLDVMLHRGGARIARPFSRSEKGAAAAKSTGTFNHTNTAASYASTVPSSPKSTVAALPNSSSTSSVHAHRPSHLNIEPNLSSSSNILPPLTPWSPSTVDYSITPSCIVHQPLPAPLSPNSGGAMRVIHMAKDNSCLFHSIAYTCDAQKPRKGLHVMQQRLRAHSLVTADPDTYTSAILGSDVTEYCNKLLNLSTWGGAIELGLFSSLYEVELFAFDFTMPTVYRFGDNNNYTKRVFLVYQGNHYEALAYVHDDGRVQEYFATNDDEALRRAQELVEGMYLERQAKTGHKVGDGKGKDGQVVWAGQGLYELKQKAKTLFRYLSPTHPKRALAPSAAAAAASSSASPSSPPSSSSPSRPTPPSKARSIIPPPSLNPALPRMHSISIPTPLSSHARRSSFTFGLTSSQGRGSSPTAPTFHSPPPLPTHPQSMPASTSPYPSSSHSPYPPSSHSLALPAVPARHSPAVPLPSSASYSPLGVVRAVSPSPQLSRGSPSLSSGSDVEQPGLPMLSDKEGEESKEGEYVHGAAHHQHPHQLQHLQQAEVATLADSFQIL